jgi:hypothetical protein
MKFESALGHSYQGRLDANGPGQCLNISISKMHMDSLSRSSRTVFEANPALTCWQF